MAFLYTYDNVIYKAFDVITNMTSVEKQLHDGITLNPYNDVSQQTWRQSTHKHDVSQHEQLIFIHIEDV